MPKRWRASSKAMLRLGLTLFAVSLLSSPPAAAASRTHVITMGSMKFGAAPTDLRTGDRVMWVNKDIFRHTATAKDRSFDVDLPPGARKMIVLTKAGEIAVVCRYHPGMRIALRVRP